MPKPKRLGANNRSILIVNQAQNFKQRASVSAKPQKAKRFQNPGDTQEVVITACEPILSLSFKGWTFNNLGAIVGIFNKT